METREAREGWGANLMLQEVYIGDVEEESEEEREAAWRAEPPMKRARIGDAPTGGSSAAGCGGDCGGGGGGGSADEDGGARE